VNSTTTRFDAVELIIRDCAELDNAPTDDDIGDMLIVSPDDLRLIIERHIAASQRTEQQAGAAEPLAWRYRHKSQADWEYTGSSVVADRARNYTVEPLFAHPPAAEPKGMEPLSEERLYDIADSEECNPDRGGWGPKFDFLAFARAIEAAHGIKGKP